MKPNAIEDRIYAWFERHYPDGPKWTSSCFQCFRDAPLELRMVISMDKVEGEIGNGGLPQLLWNVFFHWRHVLADCEAGYEMIGALAQRAAAQEYQVLFERYEMECRRYLDRCIQEQEFSYFNQWCEYGYTVMKLESERLFYYDSGIHEERLAWLDKNRRRIESLLATPPASKQE